MDENFADKVILVIDDDDMNLRIAQMKSLTIFR